MQEAARGLKYLHDAGFTHGDVKGVSVSSFRGISLFYIEQGNILISDDTPPRACLADFVFITAALDAGQEVSCSAQIQGGTMKFMAPELLVPEQFGKGAAAPTPQADIYAFGMAIFQVREQGCGFYRFIHMLAPGPHR